MPFDINKHKEAYIKEVKSYLKKINNALVELEKNVSDQKLFHMIFHSVHTIKGLAATMRYEQTIQLCHSLEDLLEVSRTNKELLISHIDIFFESVDYLTLQVKRIEQEKPEQDVSEFISRIQQILTKIPTQSSVTNHFQLPSDVTEKIQTIEVKIARLDTLMNLTEELLVCKMRFEILKERIENPELSSSIESLGRIITDLQYHLMQVRLVPVNFIFNRFLRMTRDLAKKQGKAVDLIIEGGDLELDRLLIDEISESIVHLIKNAIDHGLETPQEREQNNKSPRGTIKLLASQSKDTAIIEIRDDGHGLNLEKIKSLAIQQQLIPADADWNTVKNSIFGNLSTTSTVTELSGRGMGLSIVKQQIDSIGGKIKVETEEGKGTAFILEIPMTLAIVKVLFVVVGNETFAIPIDSVERLLNVPANEFKQLINEDTILFEAEDIPIIHLSKIFKIENVPKQEKYPIIIVHRELQRIGLVVDCLLSTQEIVIKPLAKAVKDNKYFSGAALIGSGEMILIIDVKSLLNSIYGSKYASIDLQGEI